MTQPITKGEEKDTDTFFIRKTHECQHKGLAPMGCAKCWEAIMARERQVGRDEACEQIYDKVNEYVGAPDNPDYAMPDGSKIADIITEARTTGSEVLPEAH